MTHTWFNACMLAQHTHALSVILWPTARCPVDATGLVRTLLRLVSLLLADITSAMHPVFKQLVPLLLLVDGLRLCFERLFVTSTFSFFVLLLALVCLCLLFRRQLRLPVCSIARNLPYSDSKPNLNKAAASTSTTRPPLHTALCSWPMLTGASDEVGPSP